MALTHGFVRRRHRLKRPAQQSHRTIEISNARIVRFPDLLQQVAGLVRRHGFGDDTTFPHEFVAEFGNRIAVASMRIFWSIPVTTFRHAAIIAGSVVSATYRWLIGRGLSRDRE
jgi:hypothetical protein